MKPNQICHEDLTDNWKSKYFLQEEFSSTKYIEKEADLVN